MWVESLFPGDTGLQAFEGDKKWIVQDGFDIMTARHATTARLILRGYEAGVLLNAIPAPRPVLHPQPQSAVWCPDPAQLVKFSLNCPDPAVFCR